MPTARSSPGHPVHSPTHPLCPALPPPAPPCPALPCPALPCPAPQARLSERNIVELVNKLKQLGLLGDDLLYTTNGKEYVTRERAEAEVRVAVRAVGGRIPLVSERVPAAWLGITQPQFKPIIQLETCYSELLYAWLGVLVD